MGNQPVPEMRTLLFAIVFLALSATVTEAACTVSNLLTATTCISKIKITTIKAKELGNKGVCENMQKQFACYNVAGTDCCTSSNTAKAAMAALKMAYKTYLTDCTLDCAAKKAAAGAAAASKTLTATQDLEFADLKAADYKGDDQKSVECAYINAGKPGACVATPKKWTFTKSVKVSSKAARRKATVTFTTTVTKSDDKTKAAFDGITGVKFTTALAAVNTAAGTTVKTGTVTVKKATFKESAAGSASAIAPSILASALALAGLLW